MRAHNLYPYGLNRTLLQIVVRIRRSWNCWSCFRSWLLSTQYSSTIDQSQSSHPPRCRHMEKKNHPVLIGYWWMNAGGWTHSPNCWRKQPYARTLSADTMDQIRLTFLDNKSKIYFMNKQIRAPYSLHPTVYLTHKSWSSFHCVKDIEGTTCSWTNRMECSSNISSWWKWRVSQGNAKFY
jgi:hypothetical protein